MLLFATAARADAPKPTPIDASTFAEKATVWKDDAGRIYVLPRLGSDGAIADEVTFYGDGRTMHRQKLISFSTEGGKKITLAAWAPRVRRLPHALIEITADSATVICSVTSSKYDRKPLEPVADPTKLFAKAKFLPALWKHAAAFVGRGQGTTYYLIDTLHSGEGHRLFVGPKGKMKPIPITDFSRDSAGTIVVTKTGELEIPKDKARPPVWRQGKKTVEITSIDPAVNAYLIYRELGVYGQLGTVCEDQ